MKKPGDPIDRVVEGTDQATQEFTAELWNAKADPVEPMASTLRLEEVLKRLHDSEINVGLQSFFDDGLRVWIGDPLNGVDAAAKIRTADVAWSTEGSIARWLHEAAVSLFPDSDYAKRWRR